MAGWTPTSLALGRFRRLAMRSDETWQGGLVRMPMWIDNQDAPDGPPSRPTAAFWISLGTGLIHVDLAEVPAPAHALATLLDFPSRVKQLSARPAIIEVTDTALRDVLTEALDGSGTRIDLVDRLVAVDAALAELEKAAGDGSRIPGLMESAGMSLDRVRAFADAAAAFYTARPWRHLTNDDLIVVECPERQVPKGLAHVVVLGNGGEEFGLAFFDTRDAFEQMIGDRPGEPAIDRARGVTFEPIHHLPFADVSLWEDHGLTAAGPAAYPLAADIFLDGTTLRPDVTELAFQEALLRGLTAVTEHELDTGTWERRVTSADGDVTLRFSLPLLLEAGQSDVPGHASAPHATDRTLAQVQRWLDGQQFDSMDDVNAALGAAMADGRFDSPAGAGASEPQTPAGRAQELVYRAWDATGRQRIKLAHEALTIDPDNADALVLLGEASAEPNEAAEFYVRAVDAARRTLGEPSFAALEGQFWGHLETRPYMRARLALALALDTLGKADEAIGHYRALLLLNPNDNQGVRYLLLARLLRQGHDEDAARLLANYRDDVQATWPYARALLAFRAQGDTAAARKVLASARKANPHVVGFLVAPETLPPHLPPHFALGSPEEAVSVADELGPAFEATPGAITWVQTAPAPRRRSRTTRR